MRTLVKLGFVVMALVVGGATGCVNALAQQIELEQRIAPLECVYTTTQTGGGLNMDSTCDNQPVPLLTSVDINNGRPILRGTFNASRSLTLRVWIDGQWYTLGVDGRLMMRDDDWRLDLSGLKEALRPGWYSVVVEVETTDGLLLRNTDAGMFNVPIGFVFEPVLSPTLQELSQYHFQAGFFVPTVLSHTQEGLELPGIVNAVPPSSAIGDHHQGQGSEMENNLVRIVLAAAIPVIVLGGAWTARSFWRR